MLFRWDSDRYLRKNYAWAKSYYSPDVVIFLGDLIDEGVEATESEYMSYVNRFYSIYPPSDGKKINHYPETHLLKNILF